MAVQRLVHVAVLTEIVVAGVEIGQLGFVVGYVG